MGNTRPFTPVRLVVGLLISQQNCHDNLIQHIIEEFGPLSQETPPFPFTFTDYYVQEMGSPIMRSFLVFSSLVDPSTLAQIKIRTNHLEKEFALEGKRRVNLDPGILSCENFILATTKNRSHRIPLSLGMYGEVTLLYKNREFQSLPWTYADYRSDEIRELFSLLRKEYMVQLRKEM